MVWEQVAARAITAASYRRLRNPEQLDRFAVVRRRYDALCQELSADITSAPGASGPYEWGPWASTIRAAFRTGVPDNFLSHALLRRTMVFAPTGIRATHSRIAVSQSVITDSLLRDILREDCIGRPLITNAQFLTSGNRAHHVAHLAHYHAATGAPFWDQEIVLEWGGGYGNMARVMRRANPGLTYVIVDLPELLALQFVYLASCEGHDCVHIARDASTPVRRGRINLVTSQRALEQPSLLRADAFIGTWSLTESPVDMQRCVAAANFYGARSLLLASKRDANNVIAEVLARNGALRVDVPPSRGLSSDNDYWFRRG